jgi:hypothetical protein
MGLLFNKTLPGRRWPGQMREHLIWRQHPKNAKILNEQTPK